jgi:hypothetical protein
MVFSFNSGLMDQGCGVEGVRFYPALPPLQLKKTTVFRLDKSQSRQT